jgi:hypothetical protein
MEWPPLSAYPQDEKMNSMEPNNFYFFLKKKYLFIYICFLSETVLILIFFFFFRNKRTIDFSSKSSATLKCLKRMLEFLLVFLWCSSRRV